MWKPTLKEELRNDKPFIEFPSMLPPFEIKWDELKYQPSRPVEVEYAQAG